MWSDALQWGQGALTALAGYIAAVVLGLSVIIAEKYFGIRVLRWSSLAKIGQSKIINSLYLWLLVVPVAASALSSVDTLDLTRYVPGLKINLVLPFSWKLFYLGALCCTAARSLFAFKCPALIREFPSFADFQQQGRSIEHLREYDGQKVIKDDDGAQSAFWAIYRVGEDRNPEARLLCGVLYAMGFLSFGVVLVQNAIFVFKDQLLK